MPNLHLLRIPFLLASVVLFAIAYSFGIESPTRRKRLYNPEWTRLRGSQCRHRSQSRCRSGCTGFCNCRGTFPFLRGSRTNRRINQYGEQCGL